MFVENMSEKSPEIMLLWTPENIIEWIKKKGYIVLPREEMKELDRDELSKKVKEEGFEVNQSDGSLIINPNQIEAKTVNVYKGLKPEDKEGGWREITRTGDYAILVKEK